MSQHKCVCVCVCVCVRSGVPGSGLAPRCLLGPVLFPGCVMLRWVQCKVTTWLICCLKFQGRSPTGS